MITMRRNFFQGHAASSSSIEADYLRLTVDDVHSLAKLVSKGLQLNERKCQDLSSKLVQTVEIIQKLVPPSGPLKVSCRPALKNLHRVLEKTKLLVHQCCATDWCRAAVFQIHNEGAFREVLQEVGLCYNVIYELTKAIIRDWEWTLIEAEELRQSSLFFPAPESEVLGDQQTLKRSLENVADISDDQNACLAKYLLGKLECISAARMNADLSVPDALLWINETEPQETWKLQRVIGSGSGASCVCRYEWLGIPCARKEFHCRVAADIFHREAAILAQLNHPNIVKFFCCSNGPEMGECFIARELMEMSLDSLTESRAKARRSFPILVVLDIMTQIARGVCYLHGLNIAHRDLKPLNVVVTETRAAHLEDCFSVKLVDFEMSKTKVQVSKSNTIPIPGVGTTKYRAPEVFPQAQRVAPGLKRKVNWFLADAYSFGITCAVLLSLKKPFEDVTASELYEGLLQGVRPELPGECPEALVSLLRDCWATDPHCRPGFAEICSRLEPCKLHELLRVSTEGMQGVAGSEYIKTVWMKQSEQSLCSTGLPYVHSQGASTVSFNSHAAKEGVGNSQFDEEVSPTSDDYSDDRQGVVFSESEPKKRVGLWSHTMSSLAHVMSMDALLSKNLRESRAWQLQFQQKFDVNPTLFPYNELRLATRDFHKDMYVGESSSGAMYKGKLPNGSWVAVNKSWRGVFSIDDFSNEVILFMGIKHKNLVTLKGCSLHDSKGLVLVYEYVENFDVHHILLGPSRQMLTWPVQFKICLGVAQGLHYLQESFIGTSRRRLFFLDRNLDPKIGSFSSAAIFPDIVTFPMAGTKGYLAPDCLLLTEKVDVYDFGILCLEIISGRRGIELSMPRDQVNLREWAWRATARGRQAFESRRPDTPLDGF